MNSLPPKPLLTRRGAIGALAAAPAAVAVSAPTPAKAGPGVCILAPQAVEGPFYFDPALMRSDIAEGLPGVPLELRLQLIEAADCAPTPGVRIDVWHADAGGRYSGYAGMGAPGAGPSTGETFMRGAQISGPDGGVTFRTVYPGWYRGRTPHIHVKAFIDGRNVLTTQLYFPDALSEYIYEKVAAYSGRGSTRDTTNKTDGVLADTHDGRATFVYLREESDRYVAALTIAVDRRATPPVERRPPPPPPGDRRGPPRPGERRGPPPGEGMGAVRARPSGPLVPGEQP